MNPSVSAPYVLRLGIALQFFNSTFKRSVIAPCVLGLGLAKKRWLTRENGECRQFDSLSHSYLALLRQPTMNSIGFSRSNTAKKRRYWSIKIETPVTRLTE